MFACASSKLHISGRGRSLFFNSLLHYYSTRATPAAAAAQTQKTAPTTSSLLQEYLVNSLGFSKQEAISTSSKLARMNPIKKDPDSVINFFFNLGLTKTHIKKLVLRSPQLLFSSVDRTLQPKVSYLQGLGLSGLDLVTLLVGYDRILIRGLDNHLIPRVEYLRKFLGTDEKVVRALKKFVLVPGNSAAERMEQNVVLLRNNGFSDHDIAKFVLKNPIRLFIQKTDKLQDVLHRVEHDWGIPRNTKMFYHGIGVLLGNSRSRIDIKFEILRSYGWSNVEIMKMVRIFPPVLNLSDAKLKNVLDYFMKEVGCSPDNLSSQPALFTLSLEGRVKPRHEVLKILNEKKLNKRKAASFRGFYLRESQFLDKYLLPYKEILPDMYESYLKKVGAQKIKQL